MSTDNTNALDDPFQRGMFWSIWPQAFTLAIRLETDRIFEIMSQPVPSGLRTCTRVGIKQCLVKHLDRGKKWSYPVPLDAEWLAATKVIYARRAALNKADLDYRLATLGVEIDMSDPVYAELLTKWLPLMSCEFGIDHTVFTLIMLMRTSGNKRVLWSAQDGSVVQVENVEGVQRRWAGLAYSVDMLYNRRLTIKQILRARRFEKEYAKALKKWYT